MKSLYITIISFIVFAMSLTGCRKTTDFFIDKEGVDIEIILYVKDIKGNNMLAPEHIGRLGDSEIYAEYKGEKYSLSDKEKSGLLFRMLKNPKGEPQHLEFGPISGKEEIVEQPLIIYIGSEQFKIIITNKYEVRPGKSPLIQREVFFNGKNYYSGRTIINIIVQPRLRK